MMHTSGYMEHEQGIFKYTHYSHRVDIPLIMTILIVSCCYQVRQVPVPPLGDLSPIRGHCHSAISKLALFATRAMGGQPES